MDSTSSLIPLDASEIHVWYVRSDAIDSGALLDRYRALLSEHERSRRARFLFEKDRHTFLVTRALVRTMLSRYFPLDPREWAFVDNRYGRPRIASPHEATDLCFNVSHTRGLVALAIARDREIGVDVEELARKDVGAAVADRFFSEREVHDLRRHDPQQQRRVFFEYWTLKESYIKARGMGLSLPLDQFSFHLSEGESATISFGEKIDDDAASWRFTQFQPTQHHLGALAVRCTSGAAPAVRLAEVIPLADSLPLGE